MNIIDYENNLLRAEAPVKRPFALITGILINVVLYLMFLLILVYMTFAPVPISGNSMLPTIIGDSGSVGEGYPNGDTVVVNKLFRTPAYTDIVVVDLYKDGKAGKDDKARLIIKRAIATAGDSFAFKQQSGEPNPKIDLYVKRSGETEYTVLDESYILEQMTADNASRIFKDIALLPHTAEVTDETATAVPAGMVLCLGDNRNDSRDSRYHGLFHVSSLYGRYVCTLKEGTLVNWFFSQFYVINQKSE